MLQSLVDRAGQSFDSVAGAPVSTNPYRQASASRTLSSPPPAYTFNDPREPITSKRDVVPNRAGFVADGKYFRGGVEPRATDIFIAVMGVTGSGKSTLISHCTERAVQVGHSLHAYHSISSICSIYSADVNIYLIDTPGFDDTKKSDLEVLKEVATWLTDSFRKNIRINGILYLHRITDPRMQGSDVRSLNMFRKLCGPEALKNVILVTTMWEKVNVREGEARVQELTSADEFWGCMIARGSRVERHTNDRDSALRLIKALLNRQGITLKVQEEMVNDGKSLDETGAGIELESLLAKERAKWQRQMEETQAEYRAALLAKDGEWAAMLKKQEEELNKKMRETDQKREQMRINMETMLKERYKKLEELMEKQRLELQHIQASQLSSIPRTRSHPGRNRILEFRSFALVDKYFFFCGPASCESSLPANIKSQLSGQTGIRLVALGMWGNYWVHWHDDRGNCRNIIHLSQYASLESAIRYNPKLGCPKFVSLGVDGTYFANFRNNNKLLYKLPQEATSQADFDISKVKAVWLGAQDTFVIMRIDRRVKWSTKLTNGPHLYPGLVDHIRAASATEPRIKALALNLTNPKCYAVAWRNGRVCYGSAGVFDGFLFEEFATRNFGTTFV